VEKDILQFLSTLLIPILGWIITIERRLQKIRTDLDWIIRWMKHLENPDGKN